MNRWQLWLGLGFLVMLAGCDISGLAINGKGPGPQFEVDEVKIEREALTSNLALMSKESAIRVGQKLNTALVGGFRKPLKGVTLRELPPGVSAEFSGLGWETPERTVSLVAKEDDVFLALDMLNTAKAQDRDDLVSRYQFLYGEAKAKVSGPKSDYWFWEDGPVRVMICAVNVGDGMFRLTAALGLKDVMDRLRMDEDSAKRDVAAATQISAENSSK